jgi:molecular chaperone DnaK (HSP70)
MSGVVHGIDFGTSTSSIMVARRGSAPVKVRDPASTHGAYAVPSAVCLQGDGSPAVGSVAESARRIRPQSYRTEFKRDFGAATPIRLGEHSYRPDELAAFVLGFLREQALAQVPGEPQWVVITVPAAWERRNRELMVDAAVAAGYPRERVTLATEPAAAAVYACADRGGEAGTELVYDLGGGTFDVAVARAGAAGPEILGAPGGLADIGGVEFDRLVLGRIQDAHPDEFNKLFDPAGDADLAVLGRRFALRDLGERLKRELSVAEAPSDLLTPLGVPAVFELTRAGFADLAGPLLAETFDECERLLASLGMSWADIDTVVPVGGSSRLPLVGELLAQRTGRRVAVVDEPELAIVHGAVLLAAMTAWPPEPLAASHPATAPQRGPALPEPPPDSPPPLDPVPAPTQPRRLGPDFNPFTSS